MLGHYLLNHAKTAKQIWMKFGTEIAHPLNKHIGYFLS